MKPYFYSKDTNFGDALNQWLWERLLPGVMDGDDRIRFGGIGTILSDSMPPAECWIVFTSGIGYPPLPPSFGSPAWNVIAVRGPLSAAVLGLPANAAVTDGAILVAGLPEYAPLPERQRDGIVFVPHHKAQPFDAWRAAAESAGIEYLSPLTESRDVIARLRCAKLVLADAMHAAILADAMRVPWVPLATSPHINTFKWMDWTLSMKMPYAPVMLPPPSLAGRVRNATLFMRGENFAFSPDDPAQALAWFRRSNSMRQQAWWRRVRRFGQRLVGRAERQLQASYPAGWRRSTDHALMKRAADSLAAAVAGPSYLSAESVFRDRLAALQSRLELVRAAALESRIAPLFQDPRSESAAQAIPVPERRKEVRHAQRQAAPRR